MLWKGGALPGWLGGHATTGIGTSAVASADANPLVQRVAGTAAGAATGRGGQASLPGADDRISLGGRTGPTPQEVAWMRRNGYPMGEQFARYGHASAALLPLDGVARSPEDVVNAEVVSMTDPAHREAAEAVMRNAAEQGSIFALGALGRAAAGNRPVDSAAYLRLASMRGDWTTAFQESLDTLRPLNFRDAGAATLRSYQIEQQINEARRARGLPPLSRDPRPGWAEAYQHYYRADSPAPSQGGGGG